MFADVAQPFGRAPEAALSRAVEAAVPARASAAVLSLASSEVATPALSMAPLARAARTSSMMLWGLRWGGASNARLVRDWKEVTSFGWPPAWSLIDNTWSKPKATTSTYTVCVVGSTAGPLGMNALKYPVPATNVVAPVVVLMATRLSAKLSVIPKRLAPSATIHRIGVSSETPAETAPLIVSMEKTVVGLGGWGRKRSSCDR